MMTRGPAISFHSSEKPPFPTTTADVSLGEAEHGGFAVFRQLCRGRGWEAGELSSIVF